jgi:hypothetical protein
LNYAKLIIGLAGLWILSLLITIASLAAIMYHSSQEREKKAKTAKEKYKPEKKSHPYQKHEP